MSNTREIITDLLDLHMSAEVFTQEEAEEILINNLLDIQEEVDKDPTYILKLIEEIKEVRLEQNRCPKCGIKMDVAVSGYENYEAWGSEFNMPVTYGVCTDCGYNEN